MDMNITIGMILIVILPVLIAVLITRWIFRINKIVSTLEKILKELRQPDVQIGKPN
jgi:predicted Na+-dependent transporter